MNSFTSTSYGHIYIFLFYFMKLFYLMFLLDLIVNGGHITQLPTGATYSILIERLNTL